MCGRFTLKTPPDQWGQVLVPLLPEHPLFESWQPRYNIAPTQMILGLAKSEPEQAAEWNLFRWGLLPGWANELSIGNRMINARSETVDEKRSFSGPLAKRRCLIVADGYYEWKKIDGGKQPFWIAPTDGGVILLAGLWEVNRRATEREIRSCTLITTAANTSLREIHDRMPVVLQESAAKQWLDPDCSAASAKELLDPAENGFLQAQPVSTHVNSPRHEGPECLEPPT